VKINAAQILSIAQYSERSIVVEMYTVSVPLYLHTNFIHLYSLRGFCK